MIDSSDLIDGQPHDPHKHRLHRYVISVTKGPESGLWWGYCSELNVADENETASSAAYGAMMSCLRALRDQEPPNEALWSDGLSFRVVHHPWSMTDDNHSVMAARRAKKGLPNE